MQASFSGCGFLLPFHLGVAKVLKQSCFVPQASKYAGASGGAIVATALACDMPIEHTLGVIHEVADECHRHGTGWKLESVLSQALKTHVPDTAVKDIHRHGNLSIAATWVWPQPGVEYISRFESKDDLIQTILTSCFIPGYSTPSLCRRFRQRYAIDGGLVQFVPKLPHYVKVSALPEFAMRSGCDIYPDLLPEKDQFPLHTLIRNALLPPSPRMLDQLFKQGQLVAEIYLEQRARV